MEYINDINIIDAVVHILESNADKPVLNEYKLELTDGVYKFLYKHMNKALNDEELRYAKFNSEGGIVKDITQEYLTGVNRDLVVVSQEIASQMFSIMKMCSSIPSCDLITVYMNTDQGPMIAILKIDYAKNFTHKVEIVEDKIGINIVEHLTSLPASIKKCAFIKPMRQDQEVNLMIIDKKKRANSEDEYGANYFTNNFLNCSVIMNERDMTKTFLNATETWIRNNMHEDANRAEKIRTKIKNEISNEDNINIHDLAFDLFFSEPDSIESFETFVMGKGLEEEIAIDRQFADKKLSKFKLNIDRDIELNITEDAYENNRKFEIQRNGDGTINMVIKNIANYIVK